LSGVVVWVESLLLTVLADHLPKITLLIQQADAYHRHTQIARGFQLIAGHIAKST